MPKTAKCYVKLATELNRQSKIHFLLPLVPFVPVGKAHRFEYFQNVFLFESFVVLPPHTLDPLHQKFIATDFAPECFIGNIH